MESLNLPTGCSLSFSTFTSTSTFNPSSPYSSLPPPSYYSSDSPCPSPHPTLPSVSTLLEFNVLLTPKEEDLMSSCLDRLMK